MPTMVDVARRAGVSPSTVSYVMTGKRPIGESTRWKVLAAAKELGWAPNSAARALRSARANTLALIPPRQSHSYGEVQGALLYAVARAAEERGYDLLLKGASDDPEAMSRLAQSSGADAVILTDVLMEDGRVRELARLDLPFVLLGRVRDPEGMAWVDVDFGGAGRNAVDRLADHGHSNIVLFGPPQSAYEAAAGYAVRTLEGAQDAARRRGVNLVTPVTTETLDGFAAEVTGAFDEHPEITAVILQYEPATGLLAQILARGGRRIPSDVSVVAIAPRAVALHSQPPLDYIDLHLEQMARLGVELAVDLLAGKRAQPLLLPAEITEVGSISSPPAR